MEIFSRRFFVFVFYKSLKWAKGEQRIDNQNNNCAVSYWYEIIKIKKTINNDIGFEVL